MFRTSKTRIKTLVLTSIAVCGLGGLTGCGSKSATVLTNTQPASPPQKDAYQQFKPARYAAAPSVTKKWMQMDASTHSLTLSLALSANDLSLNGFYRGFAEIEVPVGWKVKLSFHNKNPDIAGKLVVAGPRNKMSPNVTPAIRGAITPTVHNASKPTTVEFTPRKAGTYMVEFLPTAQSGTWLWFVVDSNSTTPEVKLRTQAKN